MLAWWMSPYWWVVTTSLLLVWPLKVLQLARTQRRRGLSLKVAYASGFLLMLGKVPQLLGLLGYHYNRVLGQASQLIEYH
jgi:hypothetical protein